MESLTEIHLAAPHKFSRKLQDAIGDEAAEAMVDWMNGTDQRFDRLDRQVADLGQIMRADFAEVRQEMDAKFGVMNTRLLDVREEMRVGFARAETAAAQRHTDFMKWTMGFRAASLVTYVAALVALAKVLR